jgi:hypothetical protein
MNETLERLAALDGARVWVAIVRAVDQHGPAIFRSGDFHLFEPVAAGEAALTRVTDADGLPLVTLLGTDTLSVVEGALRAEMRSSFRVDVLDRPFPDAPLDNDALITYEQATRELVAELEAGFRAALLMRPDPDHDASSRARYRIPPIEEGPLRDWSMRFAVGHNSATVRPHDDGIVHLSCVGSSLRDGAQVADRFEPAGGAEYALTSAGTVRLANDIRAFLANRRERFIPLPSKRPPNFG